MSKANDENKKAEKVAWIAILLVIAIGLGLAWAGSQGSQEVGGWPIFGLGIAIAFLVQWIVFFPSFLNRTEKYFDLTGSLTYLTVMALALALTESPDIRSLLLFAMVSIWALRLGSFLYSRIKKAGEDKRFLELKQSFPRFLMTWTLQGLWVSFSLATALAALASTVRIPFELYGWIGLLVWIFGFTVEVIADRQKSAFRTNPENDGAFIKSGLWSWSRHPNYFGEIVLWLGIAIIAYPVLSGWQLVTLISPIFVFLLLTRISGIPMLERSADERWGGQEDYEVYKARTSVLALVPPRKDGTKK